jgi:hypothetical protein
VRVQRENTDPDVKPTPGHPAEILLFHYADRRAQIAEEKPVCSGWDDQEKKQIPHTAAAKALLVLR